jgi:hypothetical protein
MQYGRPAGPAALVQVLAAALVDLRELRCWSVISGHGSRVSLDFGTMVRREQPLTNAHLTEDQRRYVGTYSLFIECLWVLSAHDTVLCTWEDAELVMEAGLAALVGRAVEQATVDPRTLELSVTLSDCHALSVRTVQLDEGLDGYSLFTPTGVLTVTADGLIASD